MKTWYERIKELREDLDTKTNQTDVATALHMTQRKLSYIETGKTQPSIEDLVAICRYYGVSADYIIGLSDEGKDGQ